MSTGGRVLVALCALVAVLLTAQNSIAAISEEGLGSEKGETDPLPDECTFEAGELGSYIVVLHDWVEEPEPIARDQVERYGGTLGFIYKYGLKGYSARFLPASATALQAEPMVEYVSIDQLTWWDNSSGVIQWHSCPLAPPLGPKPPAPGVPGEETAPAEVDPVPPAPAPVTPPSGAPETKSQPTPKRCKKRSPKKSKQARTRCGRRHTQPKRATALSSFFGGVEQTRHQLN